MTEKTSQIEQRNLIGQALRELRLAARLTQAEAAEGLGVDTQTVSRWERGERQIKARDFTRASDWYLSRTVTNETGKTVILGNTVSRGTTGYSSYMMPADLLVAIRSFERDVIRDGASDFEIDLISEVIGSQALMRLYQTGGGASTLDTSGQIREFESFAGCLRLWLKDRLGRREGIEPVQAADVPAEVERHRVRVARDKKPRS